MQNTSENRQTSSRTESPDRRWFPSRTGDEGLGLWSCTDSLATIGMMAKARLDYVSIDLQHGMLSPADLHVALRLVEAGGMTCVVRVPWNRPESIMHALDAGARLVIVPMVDGGDGARRAAEATRYPAPGGGGGRSWGPLWPDMAREPVRANDLVGCLVMIETAAGLDRLDEIVDTPGIAGVYVGPNDLALGLGHGRATYLTEPAIARALDRVAAACASRGLIAGLHCSGVAMARHWRDRGFSMLTVGTDTSLLSAAVLGLEREALEGDGGEGRPVAAHY